MIAVYGMLFQVRVVNLGIFYDMPERPDPTLPVPFFEQCNLQREGHREALLYSNYGIGRPATD